MGNSSFHCKVPLLWHPAKLLFFPLFKTNLKMWENTMEHSDLKSSSYVADI